MRWKYIIDKVLNEAMDEMALPKRNFGKSGNASKSNAGGADGQDGDGEKREPKYGRIGIGPVTVVKETIDGEKVDVLKICLVRVFKEDATQIARTITSSCQDVWDLVAAEAKPDAKDGFRVILYITPDHERLEEAGVYDKICDAIAETGHYTQPSVNLIRNTLADYILNTATEADVKASNTAIANNWKEMLQKLQDPEVRDRLMKYQMTDSYANAYGHILSPDNVVAIRFQFPSASFVCERSTWKRCFNRTIMPGATPILVKQPGYIDVKDLDAAAVKCGYKSYNDAMVKTNNSTQLKNHIRIEAVNMNGNHLTFQTVRMYDVSQTIPPSNPSDDVWTNQIGLSDNLTGVLNQKAAEYDANITDPEVLAKRDKNRKKVDDRNKKLESDLEPKAWAIIRLCNNSGVNLSAYEDLFIHSKDYVQQIQRGTYEYAKHIMPKEFGIIKGERIELIAKLVTIVVSISCGLTVDDILPDFTTPTDNIRKENAVASFSVAQKVLGALIKSGRINDIERIKTANEMFKRMGRRIDESNKDTITMDSFIAAAKKYFGPGSRFYVGGEQEDSYKRKDDGRVTVENRIRKIVSEEILKVMRRRR